MTLIMDGKHRYNTKLSNRETQTLRLMSSGLDNLSIGTKMFIGTATVERHIQSIYDKLDIPDGMSKRVWCVLYYLSGTLELFAID